MRLLTSDKAHPIALLHFLSSRYSIDWMEWPINVLEQTIRIDFKIDPAKSVLHKAMAAAVLATRDEFWKYWETFHFITQALNGPAPVAAQLQEHTLGEMMVAVDIAIRIRQDLKELSHIPIFSDEVAKYVAVHAKNKGVWLLLPPLDFAADHAAGKWYICHDCGNQSPVMFNDGHCDVCSGRFNLDQLTHWKPDPAITAKGYGNHIQVFEKNPTTQIRTRLVEARKDPSILGENQLDISVARILAAIQYMTEIRGRISEGVE